MTDTTDHDDLTSSRIILGLMRIADLSDAEINDLVRGAMELGINFFDHADVYGGVRHRCEQRFGDAVTFTDAERADVVVQSKVGLREGFWDFSKEHILTTVDESLTALNLEYLDVLLLHRPDALVEPEEVAEAFDQLHASGKVRHFGVSNHTPPQVELLKHYVTQPLIINQVQLSITHAPLLAQGTAANMAGRDQSIGRDYGMLDYSRLTGMTLQAWSPFQKGFFDGVFLGDREHFAGLNDVIDELATAYGVPAAAIATAWITRHPAHWQVVIGTTTPERVAAAAQGSDIPLTRPEWYEMFRAAGYTVP